MIINLMCRFLLALALFISLLLPSHSFAIDWGVIGLGPTADGGLAARLDLKPGWKVVADLEQIPTPPASADIDGRALRLIWPMPSRFTVFNLQGIGWSEQVRIGIGGAAGRQGRLTLRLVVCETACVPVEAVWDVVDGYPVASMTPEAIVLPQVDFPKVPARIDDIRLLVRPDGLLLIGEAGDAALRGVGDTGMRPPQKTPEGLFFPEAVAKGPVMVWTWNPDRSGSLTPVISETIPWLVLGLAFLGGVLLTVMPCVLPLLFVKAVALGRGATDRRSLLATSVGAIMTFLTIGLALGIASALGRPVVWGSLFQEPAALTLIAGIVLLGALWMGPLPAPSPPAWARHVATRLPSGKWGDVGGGALLAILALPCTAPFLGAAAGLAFAGPAWHIPLVFFSAGVGFALPWVLLSIFPSLVVVLPRPGRWMYGMKGLAGLSLVAIALWLLSILADIAGITAAMLTASLLAIGLLLTLYFYRSSIMLGTLPVAILASVLMAAPTPANPPPPGWHPFTSEALDLAENAGEVLLIEVTANWCITCRINRAIALDRLDLSNVRALQANMTGPNPEASALLRRYGRAGLPFVLVQGPGLPEGRVLPEILTPDIVQDALEQAKRVSHHW